jgi:hypothetical protein
MTAAVTMAMVLDSIGEKPRKSKAFRHLTYCILA